MTYLTKLERKLQESSMRINGKWVPATPDATRMEQLATRKCTSAWSKRFEKMGGQA